MTTRRYSSRSQQTTLSANLSSSATEMTVVSAALLLGGVTISAGQTFTVVLDPDTALEEIVDVTAIVSNTLTIVRGLDGGTGTAHSAGAAVRHMIIGRDLREANLHIEATAEYNDGTGTHSVHGVTGTVVGTTDTQTLTNKDLSSATNTLSTSVVTLTGTQTLTNKTLTTPTIASFTNATHTHLNSAGGGQITTAAISDFQESVEDTVGAMVSGNTENGLSVTYDDATGKYNFDVNDPVITIAGDVTGSATMTNLGDTTITVAIPAGTILNADVNASAAIAKTKLDLGGTITSADLVDGTIVASDIADGTITAAKLVSDPYARANHTGTQLAATVSDFDTQVRTSRLDQMAAPTAAVSLNSQKVTSLATPTDNADAATKLYVDTKVADLVNSAPGTLDTLGEIATAIQAGGTVYDSFVLKAGSTMTGALTLSGAPTVDLHAATKAYVDTVAGSATAAAASAAAAATSYDDFDDRYLGAKSTPPTLDNDGNALITGALYWNSVSNAMFAWDGSAWASISSTADIYRYRYTATGGETSKSGIDDNGLTLSYIVGKEQVYLNGVLLARTTDYVATDGTSIASLGALTAGDILEVITFTPFEIANVLSPTLFDAKGDLLAGTGADTVGKLTVGTNGYFLKADSSTSTGLAWGAVVTNPLTGTGGDAGDTIFTGTTAPSSPTTGDIWFDAVPTTQPDLTLMTIMGAY
jgi:hypothetical protein